MAISEPLMSAGAEAVAEVSSAMLLAAGQAMSRHGNDPNNSAILGAAVGMMIERINDHIDPNFKRHVMRLMELP